MHFIHYLLAVVPPQSGPIGDFLNFIYWVGSLVCFQWEVATFKVGAYYLPVCSGCLGIYGGALIGFASLPRLSNLSKQLFQLRFAIPLMLPQSVYFFILNFERFFLHSYPIPGIKEIYFVMGLLFGFVLCNIAFRLAVLEDDFYPAFDQHLTKFVEHIGWLFLPGVLIGIVSIMLGLALYGYAIDMLLLVLGSLSFILGIGILLILIVGFSLRFAIGISKTCYDYCTQDRSN
ncbi:MAG: hypothetical protein ACW963_07285 [Candidatus Sifarchaeia archaeon]|jgi:uncharacterized membrane protein